MIPFLVETGRETLLLTVGLCGVLAPFLMHEYTRPVIFATVKFIKRHAPWWAVPVMVACQFIVGPVDDVAALLALAIPVFRIERNRRVYARAIRMIWRDLGA